MDTRKTESVDVTLCLPPVDLIDPEFHKKVLMVKKQGEKKAIIYGDGLNGKPLDHDEIVLEDEFEVVYIIFLAEGDNKEYRIY